jgi:hypothetical protein
VGKLMEIPFSEHIDHEMIFPGSRHGKCNRVLHYSLFANHIRLGFDLPRFFRGALTCVGRAR